jgi:protein TonB
MTFAWRRLARTGFRALYAAVFCVAWGGGDLAASPKTAARPPPDTVAAWRNAVHARLSQFKFMPRGGFWMGGTAVVHFAIDRRGNIVGSRIARSLGDALLDKSALATILMASPVPPPPDGLGERGEMSFSVPIRFQSHW